MLSGGLSMYPRVTWISVVSLLVGFALLGYAYFRPSKVETTLILRTSSGDIQALTSEDKNLVSKVKDAIETAFSRHA
jgi:Family of unknown function (DUF6232)